VQRLLTKSTTKDKKFGDTMLCQNGLFFAVTDIFEEKWGKKGKNTGFLDHAIGGCAWAQFWMNGVLE